MPEPNLFAILKVIDDEEFCKNFVIRRKILSFVQNCSLSQILEFLFKGNKSLRVKNPLSLSMRS